MLDLRYALRSLSRARGFTLAVVLTLGLDIGANTATFSVVRGVLLKPLPHRDGDRLVYLRHSISGPGGENILFSVPEILDFRNSARTLRGIAEYSGMIYTLTGESDAVRINVGLVTGNFFQIMGLSPVLGRLLNDGDDGTNRGVGIAGVLAFSVSARSNEIGIRMSLGADSGKVQRMLLAEGGVLLGLGLLLGVAGALFATRLIRGLLFGVTPHDPLTLAGVAALMAAVGIGACWLPALRAARIDPAVAIRSQ